MARTISKGEVTLTKLRSYKWDVVPTSGGVQVYETYVVTDDGYTVAPEGQQRKEVELTSTEKTALVKAFSKYQAGAATREQVEIG